MDLEGPLRGETDVAHADRLAVGVVGLGYWGPNLVRVLSALANVELSWICDCDEGRLARWASRYPGARASLRCEDLWADPELDAVLIATPVFTHFELATKSLDAGKHTFVEKPLATSSAEAERLLELARSRRRVLMCGHTFLYSPPVRLVKDLLDRGELGEVQFISSSRVNLGVHQADVSVVWDLGPHDLSILRYWLGELPEQVTAIGKDSVVKGIPDVAFVTLRFPSGVLVNLEMSWLAPSKLRRTVIVGSEKMVVYEDGAAEPVRVFDHGVVHEDPASFGEYQLSYRTGEIISPHVEGTEPLAIQLGEFAESARSGVQPEGHAEMSADVVRVIQAVERSLNADGAAMGVPGVTRHLEQVR